MVQQKGQTSQKEQLSQEYVEKVSRAVYDGSFFRDSMQWYIFQYVRPSVDRNLMIAFSLIGVLCVYYLYDIIMSSFPLVEEVPVVIREYDTSIYNPIIKKLKNNTESKDLSADEVVLKYLVLNYVKERESFDFKESDVKEVNRKFNVMKNNSSYLEYRSFRAQMSRSNPNSPIHFFGRDVHRDIEISSFKIIKSKSKNKINMIKRYFSPKLSDKAEVRFRATVFSKNKDGQEVQSSKRYLAKITFDFSGLSRDEKSGVLGFAVKDYDLFEIK